MTRTTFTIGILLAVALTGGCATRQTMYQWGGYDELLYQSYKSPEKTVAMREALEAHVARLEGARQKAAPGLYAELGTLYFESGNPSKAMEFYAKEKSSWPESGYLMDALIKTAGSRVKDNNATQEAAK